MKTPLLTLVLALIFPLLFQIILIPANSQQSYVDNNQLNCGTNFSNTNGFLCNGINSTCSAYVTFRSNPPDYDTAPSIAFLLNSSTSDIATLNNISDVGHLPGEQLVVVPVSCGCTRVGLNNNYYQHNARYTLKEIGETYFTIANNTYQGLTTCQAMMGQNPYSPTSLALGDEFLVPIMCVCPTTEQARKYGAQYLVSYLVTWGDNITQIAKIFGVDVQSVLDANNLKNQNDVIYPFTPILVPLKSAPTNISLPSPQPAPPPQSNPNPNLTPPTGDGGSSKKWVFVGIGVGAGVLVLFLFAFVWLFVNRRSQKPVPTPHVVAQPVVKKGTESAEYAPLPGSYTSSEETKSSWPVSTGEFRVAIGSLTTYKFKELEEATEKFNEANRMKGSVFRGKFKGDNAAIKIMKGNVPTDEINLLKHINHSNIIRLSGYCIHDGNTYLVYEYAEKGSLNEWLFRQRKLDNSALLPLLGWKERVQIISNIADALNYLHHLISPPYVHKNLKSSNVLLDVAYRAKITNFGMARTIQEEDENGEVHMTKHVVGTHGYLAPEYIENGVVTTKLDVFAFGVVVLEVLSGKPAVKPMNDGSSDDLLFIGIRKVFEGENVREKLMGFMDSKLGRAYPLDLAYSMAQLAHKCVDQDMNTRPSMSEVSMMLSKINSSTLDWDPSDELTNSSSLGHTR